ncbi:MAG: hypothetical protein J0M18_02115 [Ignavibacteria bacterium]|nr:hypothetical protein [Ignavibacteria bacterium]
MKLNNRKNNDAVFNNTEVSFDYAEYLKEYYFRMARGEERVPSAKEVKFFFQELFSTMSASISTEELGDIDADIAPKQKMVA